MIDLKGYEEAPRIREIQLLGLGLSAAYLASYWPNSNNSTSPHFLQLCSRTTSGCPKVEGETRTKAADCRSQPLFPPPPTFPNEAF